VNLFQWITLPLLGVVLLGELTGSILGWVGRKASLFRALVWLAAAVAISHPDLTSDVAELVGIRRGADLVMYVFVLTFIVTTFYFYAQHLRLQRELTELVRHVAISEARRGKAVRLGDSQEGGPHALPQS
jgi:hypothetical protein